MSQKLQIYKCVNERSRAFGKYFVRAVYDGKFVETDRLADFIQAQCTVKRSDIIAVLDELGSAMKHYFEHGEKIRLKNIGVFKVGVSSAPSATKEGCSAASVKSSRVLFLPQTESVPTGETKEVTRAVMVDGVATVVTQNVRTYNHPATMLKDVEFEISRDPNGAHVSDAASGGNNG